MYHLNGGRREVVVNLLTTIDFRAFSSSLDIDFAAMLGLIKVLTALTDNLTLVQHNGVVVQNVDEQRLHTRNGHLTEAVPHLTRRRVVGVTVAV